MKQSLWWKALTIAVSAESWLNHSPFTSVFVWSSEELDDPLGALCVPVGLYTSWGPCCLLQWSSGQRPLRQLLIYSGNWFLQWILELQKNMQMDEFVTWNMQPKGFGVYIIEISNCLQQDKLTSFFLPLLFYLQQSQWSCRSIWECVLYKQSVLNKLRKLVQNTYH